MYSYPCIKEHGYSIEVQGLRRTVYGTIAAVSAGNLGSCALGGFKESVIAHHICRQCLATKEQAGIEVGGATHTHTYMDTTMNSFQKSSFLRVNSLFLIRPHINSTVHCLEEWMG